MSLPGFLSPLFLLPYVQNQLCGGEAGFKRSLLFSIFPLLNNRLFFFFFFKSPTLVRERDLLP